MAVDYPEILQAKNWDKNKGIIAKMAGETGMGKALGNLWSHYNSVDQMKMMPSVTNFGKANHADDYDKWLEIAKKYYVTNVMPLREEARKVSLLALAVKEKFKKNKLVPKSSEAYVGSVAEAAAKFATELKPEGFTQEFAMFATAKKNFVEKIDLSHSGGLADARNLLIAVTECKKLPNPTGADWMKIVKQKNRSLGNVLGNVPELKQKFWAVWQPLDGMQVDKESTSIQVKQACDKLLKELPAVIKVLSGK